VQQGALLAVERHGRKSDLMLDVSGATIQGGAQEIPILVEELVENALAFSRPGSPVKVKAQRNGSDWRLTVEDAGRGMTRQQLKNLGLFRQFDHDKFQQPGLGVGLFIVRQILRRNHGRLQIESSPGAGTTCEVTLPVAAPVRPGPGRGA
jgi:two-component system sensor histidine kinase/response regulator